jgi:hypothetical protein
MKGFRPRLLHLGAAAALPPPDPKQASPSGADLWRSLAGFGSPKETKMVARPSVSER